ncbi:MAG: ABC transporter permease [Streptosporangiales bacterium]|nr:ABC transporter permease [Streptosporangiales bacterium]
MPLIAGRLGRIGLPVVAAAVALAFAAAVTSAVLAATGANPLAAFRQMIGYGSQPDSVVNIINRGTTYYLSAVAVAIGFRMRLFNIGVDGQYRLAAMLAAAFGGFVALPPVLHQAAVIVVAALVGGLWAGIAGVLKVTRGVSEVISTIMLNFISTGIIAFLLRPNLFAVQVQGSNNIGTPPIPPSGRVPGFPLTGASIQVFGLVLLAVAVGVAFAVLVGRTRFGFDLRAAGLSPSAAVASGVNVPQMVVATMVLSGAVAGLLGMPQLLGDSFTYALDFPTGLGFTGIAIALLGRNHPVGIAFAALLWAFLDQSAQILDLFGIAKEIVIITQATVVLSVVVVYEVVHRFVLAQQQRAVGEQLGADERVAGATA